MLQNPLLHQFARFCLVGASSMTIDFSLFALLYSRGAPILLAQTFAFTVAVTNGFFWNRRWTFRAMDPERTRRQYAQFYVVNVIGFLLNTSLLYLFSHLLRTMGLPTREAVLFGKLAAVPIVAIWNFSASRFWAFAGGGRHRP